MLHTKTMNLNLVRTFVIVGQSKDLKEAASKEEAVKKVYKEYYDMQEQIGIDDSASIDFEVDGEEIDINLESDKSEYGFN